MGKIISTRRGKNKKDIIVETLLDYDEFLQLKGHLDSIYLFSENL